MRKLILPVLLGLLSHVGSAAAADGQLDPTFRTDAEHAGYGFYFNPNDPQNIGRDQIGALVERPDHKIWSVGRMRAPGAYRLSLYLLEPDGLPDVGFGDLGLRTIIQPCEDFQVSDAKLDSQDRLLVAVDNCPNYMVYAFLPNGDLDVSFAAGGLLTVAFDQGGTNRDLSQKLIIAANDDVIVAGTVATATSGVLGIARYTASGLPAAGFGIAGKVQLPLEWRLPEIRGIDGLHQMADGRIMVSGSIDKLSQNNVETKQFVVRLSGNGALDPSYGNVSAGISTVNHRNVLGFSQSPETTASTMGGDGSIVQVGWVNTNWIDSSSDIFLMKWRPDGQLDTSIGLNGTRIYALDFAGPGPLEPVYNWDSATNIVRQDNGDYLISAHSRATELYATALLRLKSNFTIDPQFGIGGKIQHTLQITNNNGENGQLASVMLLQKGRILVGGKISTGVNRSMQVVMGVQHDEIFAHTFEK